MSCILFLDKLLDGVSVEWKRLGVVADIKRGTSITKANVVDGDVPVIAGGRTPAYYHNAVIVMDKRSLLLVQELIMRAL